MPRKRVEIVRFEGRFNLPTKPRRLELRDGVGSHQIAVVDFPMPKARVSMPTEGTPVSVTWGTFPTNTHSFFGYVNHAEPVLTKTESFVRFYLIGTSLPLNNVDSGMWQEVTGSFIAREIAAKHGLRAVVNKSTEILDRWVQGNESDFKMLSRLADRVGFDFWIDASTLYFLDPNQSGARVGVLGFERLVKGENLLSFEALDGSLAPGGMSITEAFGIDAATGGLLRTSSVRTLNDRGMTLPNRVVRPSLTIGSLHEGARVSEGLADRGVWVTAQVTIRPDASIRIGDVVEVSGELIPMGYRGNWIVKAAVRVMDAEGVETTLTLTRNQREKQTFTRKAPIKAEFPFTEPVLRDGQKWESQILGSVYV